jgi:hypothetical protein
MASAKINQAIIECVLDSLARAKYDPGRARPGIVQTGFFTNQVDKMDASRAPTHILAAVQSKFPNGSQSSKQEIQQFIRREVWERSFRHASGAIKIEIAFGKSPKKYIQEAREAIDVLRALGVESYMIRLYEDQIKQAIGEE